jgi:hypothetical protein
MWGTLGPFTGIKCGNLVSFGRAGPYGSEGPVFSTSVRAPSGRTACLVPILPIAVLERLEPPHEGADSARCRE